MKLINTDTAIADINFNIVLTTAWASFNFFDNLFVWNRQNNTICDKLQWTLDILKSNIAIIGTFNECRFGVYDYLETKTPNGVTCTRKTYPVKKAIVWTPFKQTTGEFFNNCPAPAGPKPPAVPAPPADGTVIDSNPNGTPTNPP